MCTAVPPSFSASGNPACGYCKVLLARHFSQTGQSTCMRSCTHYLCTFSGGAVLHVGTAAGGAALCEHTVVPTICALSLDRVFLQASTTAFSWLCTLSRWGSPACTCSKVGVQSSIFLYLLNQFSQWKDHLVCKLWCPPVSAGSSSRKGGLRTCYSALQVGQKTWVALSPTIHMLRKRI